VKKNTSKLESQPLIANRSRVIFIAELSVPCALIKVFCLF